MVKINSPVLTKRERDTLILSAIPNRVEHRHPSNTEIAQRLGVSVSSVKATMHRICVKLGAHGRHEAILIALKLGEIRLNEIYTLDEIANRFGSLDPDMLRRIAHLVRQGLDLPSEDESIVRMDRKQDTVLTKVERDVLVLAGCALTNREIANRLCISTSSVGTFLYRAGTKLGAHKRVNAVMLALKQGEISILDIFPPDELIRMFALLGAESIEKVAQLVNQRLSNNISQPAIK